MPALPACREWWFDVVNYGSNYGAVDPDEGLGKAWDTLGEEGWRLQLTRDQDAWAAGAHPSVPRGAAASVFGQREETFWGLADLWEDELAVELAARQG